MPKNRNRRQNRRQQIRHNRPNRGPNRPGPNRPPIPPPGPPAGQNAPQPWNAQYETTMGGIRRDQADLQAQNAYQRQGIEQEYGFNDTADPYSRANLLQKSYREGQLGTTNSMAARGQLYSGATQRAREAGTFGYGQNLNALRGEYEQKLYGLNQQGLAGMRDLRDQAGEAEAHRLESSLEGRPDPQEAPPPLADAVKQKRNQRNQRGNQRRNQRRPPARRSPSRRRRR
jgi:hypothetical protein